MITPSLFSPTPNYCDNDRLTNGSDAFPDDPAESKVSDSDTIGDNADPDDDNDGVYDTNDAVGEGAARISVEEIEAYLESVIPAL